MINTGELSVTNLPELEEEIEGEGIEVQGIENADGLIGLDYYSQDLSNAPTYEGILATTYAELVDSDYETYGLLFGHVGAEDTSDAFYIDAELAQQYADGDLSKENYIKQPIYPVTKIEGQETATIRRFLRG